MSTIYKAMPAVIKTMEHIKTFRAGFVFSVNGIIRSMPSAPSSAVVHLAIKELIKTGHAVKQRNRVKGSFVFTRTIPNATANPKQETNEKPRIGSVKAKARSIATKAYENRISKKNTVQRPTVAMPEAKKRIGVIQRLQAIEEVLGL